ncbi:hypothetical protein SEA_JUSTBECAUSE_332 [Streptomyces phage JustBecause]|nr:hypothetical protein SEA_JUSTBECAUSE_332 [Streptomyces phage JustBecause]
MDLMQIAGHLSLEFGAVVTGPFKGERQDSVHVMRPDGYGVMLMMGPGKALAVESRPGGLDVWQIRETDDPSVIDISNTRDMIRYDTDLDGAREALRETGPAVWVKKDTPPARCETCGK